MNHLLEVKNLYKSFKRGVFKPPFKVLKGLNFTVPKGVAVGFLGANGSGKTTTFKCLLELIKKDSGEVYFFNKPLCKKSRAEIGFLPEKPQFYENLTGLEILYFYAGLSRPLTASLKSYIKELLKKLDLYTVRHIRLKNYSKGMLQKIGVLQALVHQPKLLILDEPFSGLDPISRFKVMNLLQEKLSKGGSLLLSSHIFQDIERLCDRLLILKNGEIIFNNKATDLKTSSGQKNIVYVLNGKKQSLLAQSLKEGQKELKTLLEKGAVILSFENTTSSLEQHYQQLITKNTKDE